MTNEKASQNKVSSLRMQKIRLEEEIEVAEAKMDDLKRLISKKSSTLKQVKGELSLIGTGQVQGTLF